jgi:CheY-like chemotaxis protein
VSDPRRFRILNVDDYQIGLYAKSRVLRQAGFLVTEAATGADALDRARAEVPDLVLLDVQLPDMSGIEVARQLKADSRTAPVLILQISATFREESTRVHALDAGADSYLVEPIQPK